MDEAPFLVVCEAVVDHELKVAHVFVQACVLTIVKLLLHSAHVHGLLDDGVVQRRNVLCHGLRKQRMLISAA